MFVGTNRDGRGGKIKSVKEIGGNKYTPPKYKKIINIETNEIINSSVELSALLGIPKREVNRQLGGERYCHIPYRYIVKGVIQNDVIIPPIKEVKKELVGKFINNVFVEMVDRLLLDEKTNGRIGKLLAGLCSIKDGITYKTPDVNGGFIEPPKFISHKKIRIFGPPTPKKPIIQLTKEGKQVTMYPSLSDAARAFGTNRRNFSKAIIKSPNNYYKGYIWKYA